jgi:hypothetical protein
VFADQFQRNGVNSVCVLAFGMAHRCCQSRSSSGFSGILKSLQQTRREWSAEKEDPPARGTSIAAPRWPFATLGRPIYPRVPYLPKGAKVAGNDAQPLGRSTDDPTRGAPRVHCATRRGSSFSGIFEIVTAHEAGGGRVKKETHLRGERRLPPLAPLRRPWPPNLPSHPLPAQGE